MTLADKVLNKISTRNFLATGTGVTFWSIITYVVVKNPDLLTNPIVTGLLGAFGTITAIVFQFYFRTAGEDPKTSAES